MVAYLSERGIGMRRSRLGEILLDEGLSGAGRRPGSACTSIQTSRAARGDFQPKHAAYLNLIEPWWKVLRSPALKERRFDAWTEIEQAIECATAYWNQHKHPLVV